MEKTFESYIQLVRGLNKVYNEIPCSVAVCKECPFRTNEEDFKCIRAEFYDAIEKAYRKEIEKEEKKWREARNCCNSKEYNKGDIK